MEARLCLQSIEKGEAEATLWSTSCAEATAKSEDDIAL